MNYIDRLRSFLISSVGNGATALMVAIDVLQRRYDLGGLVLSLASRIYSCSSAGKDVGIAGMVLH